MLFRSFIDRQDVVFVTDADEIMNPDFVRYYATTAWNNPTKIVRIPMAFLNCRADLRVVDGNGNPRQWTAAYVCLRTHANAHGLSEIRAALRQAITWNTQALGALLPRAAELGPDLFLANANSALEMLGHTVVGWMWLRQAAAAARALPTARADADFYHGKLHAARFFATHELPKVRAHAELLASADRTTLDMRGDWF